MKMSLSVTDYEWFRFLKARDELGEANFWLPNAKVGFRALTPGEPLLFKLHAPRNFVVGGGFFVRYLRLPYETAWEFFGEANGAATLSEMRTRINKYRGKKSLESSAPEIGCILLSDTFFFEEPDWIPVPSDFALNIVRGKTYDTSTESGNKLWSDVKLRLQGHTISEDLETPGQGMELFSDPVLTRRRLGQGLFRAIVADTYRWNCSVTGERARPVLEAAHIRPVSDGGLHEVPNGLLLRADVHRLFDRGYVTVTPKFEFHVSSRLKSEFNNGEPYYPFQGKRIQLPTESRLWPDREFLEWHSDSVFRP